MSLDYDLRNVSNRDLSDRGWETTQSVIFATMAVDLGKITEDNVAEFRARHVIWSRAIGLQDSSLTLKQVQDHVGLRVNVIDKTRAAFLNKIKHVLDREMDDLITKSTKEEKTA